MTSCENMAASSVLSGHRAMSKSRVIVRVRIGDCCFIACYALWMIRTILFNYTYVEVDFYEIGNVLIALIMGFGFLSVFFNWRSFSFRPLHLMVLALVTYSSVSSHSAVLLVALLMAYLGSGTQMRFIAHFAFIVSTLLIVFIGLASIDLNIPEFGTEFLYSRARLALGFTNPNVMGALAFQACAAYLYLRWERYGIRDAFILLLWALFVLLTAYSRTMVICVLLLTILKPLTTLAIRSPRIAATIPVIIICGCLIFSVIYSASNPLFLAIDEMLSYRFTLASRFISAIGFTPFGTEVPFGGVWVNNRLLSGYLDNAYVHLFLQSGFIIGLLIMTLMARTCYTLWYRDFPLMAILLAFAVYGISEQYIFNVAFDFVCISFFVGFGKYGKSGMGESYE